MIDVLLECGAVGEGVTDDSAALQAGLDIGGWVYVPAGTYRLASLPLRIGARTRLTLAPGATLLRDAAEAILTNGTPSQTFGGYTGRGQILIEGGVWDVNAAAHPEPSGGIAVAHGTGITIRDLMIVDTPSWHALEVNACKTVRVEGCRFAGWVDTADRGWSEAVQIDADTSAAAFPWFGPHDGTVCDDITVEGCWFGASGTPGTVAWPRGVGSHNTSGTNRHKNITVEGCTFEDLGDAAIQTYFWDGATIALNKIYRPGGEGIAVKDDSRYVVVAVNRIYDAGRTGIWVNTDCTRISVRGNDVVGSGASQHNAHYGIRASNNCSWLKITGNSVSKRAAGNHAKYGLSIDSTCSAVQRYGNDLRSSGATGSLYDASQSPVTSAADAL